MKKLGVTIIEEGLELKDFNWWINSVLYNWDTDKLNIEIYMQEDGKTIKHSRLFSFDTEGKVWTVEDVANAVATIEVLKGSIKED